MAGEKETAEKLLATAKGLLAHLKEAHGLKGILAAVPDVVKVVESLAKDESLKGADKKALAIEAVMGLVKLPWWLPEFFARRLLGLAIDAAVAALNKKFDKAWPSE